MFKRKTRPFKNNSNSIAELTSLEINGFDQSILIRGENTDNPLMLFLHGGPGTAQIGFAPKFQKKLEKEFIVVNWDQRGAGLSFHPIMKKEDLTIDKFLNDAIFLIESLLSRFDKEKLFLVGHSWGSVLGVMLSKRIPEYIHAYIGIGQVVNMLEGEKISYDYVMSSATKNNNHKALRELHQLEFNPYDLNFLSVQRKWLTKLRGSYIGVTDYELIFSNMLFANEYTLKDWINYLKYGQFSLETMWNSLLDINFLSEDIHFEVPVFICAGIQDFQTPIELQKLFFETIITPVKEFILFEKSAHLPNFEEVDKFFQECLKIKNLVINN